MSNDPVATAPGSDLPDLQISHLEPSNQNRLRYDMNNRIRSALVFAVFAVVMTPIALGQCGDVRRIRFQRGRSSAIVRSSVRKNEIITYLVSASAGQTMNLNISRGTAFRLYTPSGNSLQGGKGVSGATEELEETGDYRIEVESRSSKSRVSFSLNVAIR